MAVRPCHPARGEAPPKTPLTRTGAAPRSSSARPPSDLQRGAVRWHIPPRGHEESWDWFRPTALGEDRCRQS